MSGWGEIWLWKDQPLGSPLPQAWNQSSTDHSRIRGQQVNGRALWIGKEVQSLDPARSRTVSCPPPSPSRTVQSRQQEPLQQYGLHRVPICRWGVHASPLSNRDLSAPTVAPPHSLEWAAGVKFGCVRGRPRQRPDILHVKPGIRVPNTIPESAASRRTDPGQYDQARIQPSLAGRGTMSALIHAPNPTVSLCVNATSLTSSPKDAPGDNSSGGLEGKFASVLEPTGDDRKEAVQIQTCWWQQTIQGRQLVRHIEAVPWPMTYAPPGWSARGTKGSQQYGLPHTPIYVGGTSVGSSPTCRTVESLYIDFGYGARILWTVPPPRSLEWAAGVKFGCVRGRPRQRPDILHVKPGIRVPHTTPESAASRSIKLNTDPASRQGPSEVKFIAWDRPLLFFRPPAFNEKESTSEIIIHAQNPWEQNLTRALLQTTTEPVSGFQTPSAQSKPRVRQLTTRVHSLIRVGSGAPTDQDRVPPYTKATRTKQKGPAVQRVGIILKQSYAPQELPFPQHVVFLPKDRPAAGKSLASGLESEFHGPFPNPRPAGERAGFVDRKGGPIVGPSKVTDSQLRESSVLATLQDILYKLISSTLLPPATTISKSDRSEPSAGTAPGTHPCLVPLESAEFSLRGDTLHVKTKWSIYFPAIVKRDKGEQYGLHRVPICRWGVHASPLSNRDLSAPTVAPPHSLEWAAGVKFGCVRGRPRQRPDILHVKPGIRVPNTIPESAASRRTDPGQYDQARIQPSLAGRGTMSALIHAPNPTVSLCVNATSLTSSPKDAPGDNSSGACPSSVQRKRGTDDDDTWPLWNNRA
ncbi:hypothetical protein FA13DRAFT_1722648 [Coprinellus micaceus]|uniref:Uncharacterized protein n=1 Tax=Coprinellus micaceus TaxID=71717 RepID=A0A4Y7RL64_COPMI|nr:hypothetical protein FA13DRAFT_1722648 [Coprinellus micaceus]